MNSPWAALIGVALGAVLAGGFAIFNRVAQNRADRQRWFLEQRFVFYVQYADEAWSVIRDVTEGTFPTVDTEAIETRVRDFRRQATRVIFLLEDQALAKKVRDFTNVLSSTMGNAGDPELAKIISSLKPNAQELQDDLEASLKSERSWRFLGRPNRPTVTPTGRA